MSTILLSESTFVSLAQGVFSYQKKHAMPVWFYEKLGKPDGHVEFADVIGWAEKVRQANIASFVARYPDRTVDISEPRYVEKDEDVPLSQLVYFLRRVIYQIDVDEYDEGLFKQLVEFLQDEIMYSVVDFMQSDPPPRVIDETSLMQVATAIKSCRHWLIAGHFSFVFVDELGKFYFEPLRKEYLRARNEEELFEEVRYRYVDGMSIGTALRLLRQLRESIPIRHQRYSWLDELCRDLRYVFIEQVLERHEVAV